MYIVKSGKPELMVQHKFDCLKCGCEFITYAHEPTKIENGGMSWCQHPCPNCGGMCVNQHWKSNY